MSIFNFKKKKPEQKTDSVKPVGQLKDELKKTAAKTEPESNLKKPASAGVLAYKNLLYPIERGPADVVYGSRFKGGEPHRMIYYRHQLANNFLTMLSNLFTGLNLSDIETCYKMFRGDLVRGLAKKLQAKRFGFEPEITARVAKSGARVYEVGISYYGRSKEEGKKIGLKDGIKAIGEIIRYNFFVK